MTPGRSATVPARGDVILVPFPFAELTANKARPAVVVSGQECGLLKPSVVTSWLATLAPDLILMRIGALNGEQLRAAESRLRATLEL